MSAKDQENSAAAGTKLSYYKPELHKFGSVRELTGSVSGIGAGDGGTMMNPSDRAYKENIVRVGDHPAGFGIYLFDYKPEFREAFGADRQFGVMADEVEAIVPEAVVRGADGYRRVDYARIGVTRH